MTDAVLKQLPELQPYSGKHLDPRVVARFGNHQVPKALVDPKMVHNGYWGVTPKKGIKSLSNPENRQSIRKAKTLTRGDEQALIKSLNKALLGGETYPILSLLTGASLGVFSGTAGLLFSAATTTMDLNRTSTRVLARSGDVLYHVEEIGKVKDGNAYKMVHVSSYFIVDPFRKGNNHNAWLIDEERSDLV